MESIEKAFLTPLSAFLGLQHWTDSWIIRISIWHRENPCFVQEIRALLMPSPL